ncbi:hypothetical protein H4R18_003328 [Coemansia javaensis]|uniref:DUF4460 domain-containing protein n=1 Tax=Coemansia javaensis TaxID=2761396 RepID=A0A9W8LIS6_9FUNG|nr:hypothetical protein H4R18_003328 [Coemansia javaensis]
MDPARLPALAKPLVHAVLRRVHPDYFTHHPAAKAANQAAVQRLQALLAPVLAPPRQAHGPREPLEFVVRDGPGDALRPVSFAFSQRRARTDGEQQAQCARDLLALCRALGAAPAAAAVREIEAAIGQAQSASASASAGGAAARLRAARAREARANYAAGRAAAAAAAAAHAALLDGLRRAAWSPAAKTARPVLDRSRLFFAADVAPQRYADVARRIERQLPALDYARWCTLPVMVVSTWAAALRHGAPRYPGFVLMPCDVDPKEFQRYLRENLDEIQQQRRLRNAAHGVGPA